MEDKEIVDLYFERNEDAIKETSKKYGHYCYSIANNILHSYEDSIECVNDTYLKTWNAIPPHRPLVLSIFIGKITRRLSIDRWRHNSAEKRMGDEFAVSLDELENCLGKDTVKEELDEQYLSEKLDEFLSKLKKEERMIFVCRYWYFDQVKEIAERFSLSESGVKMSLKRTRDKLRIFLEKEGITI